MKTTSSGIHYTRNREPRSVIEWKDKGKTDGLIVCFFCPTREFFTQRKKSPLPRWNAANFDLWSALMAIEQWGFFSAPHLLWHGTSVNNGHLREPVTLTPASERLAVELSLPVCTTWVCRGWDSNTQLSAYEANAFTHCATGPNGLCENKRLWFC